MRVVSTLTRLQVADLLVLLKTHTHPKRKPGRWLLGDIRLLTLLDLRTEPYPVIVEIAEDYVQVGLMYERMACKTPTRVCPTKLHAVIDTYMCLNP